MPKIFFKSEHAQSVSGGEGAFMNFMGVEYPRDGLNDPLIPFSVNYDTAIPNANVTYVVPGATYGIVWAFPVDAIPVRNTGHTKGPIPPQYRRPRYAR